MERILTLNENINIDSAVKRTIIGQIGQGFYINKKIEKDPKNKIDYHIGIHCPQLIEDVKQDKRVIKFLEFQDVLKLSVEKENNKWKIIFPEREVIAERVDKLVSNSVFKTEQCLLKGGAYSKLLEIPMIQTSINPIAEILTPLKKYNKIDKTTLHEFRKVRKEERIRKYLQFLEGLEIIRKNEEEYTFGNRFVLIEKEINDKEEVFKKIMEIVLSEGYSYLTEYLKLTSIVSFLRWCNSYYYFTFKTNGLLHTDDDGLYRNYRIIYPNYVRPIKTKFDNQLRQIIEVNLLEKEGNYIVGNQEILENCKAIGF